MKEIKTTKKYELFKKLKGNRAVTPARVSIIRDSIEKVGYITNPIIVNEDYEVIEGQGRLEALKELNMPVDYIVEEGAGIEECMALNMRNTNWKTKDFIESYADRGNESYVRIKNLLEQYSYGVNVIATAVKLIGKFDIKYVKNGELRVSAQEYEKAIERLEWLNRIAPYCKSTSGEVASLLQTLIICREFENIDLARLESKVITLNQAMIPYASVPDCMQSLEEIYNRNLPATSKVYLFTEYRKWLADNRSQATARIENGGYRKESWR